MEAKRNLKCFPCHIAQIKILYSIISEKPLNLRQCSLVWEVSLGEELYYVKPQV